MSAISLKIEVELGKTPEQVIADCLLLARRLQIPIRFTHNGTDMVVAFTDTEDRAMERFRIRQERQMIIYKKHNNETA